MTIRLERPCSAPWGEMAVTAGGRHCVACARTVFDLRRRTQAEIYALDLLFGGSQGLCGRARVDAERLVVAGESRRAGVSGEALALASALALAGCNATPPRPSALAATTDAPGDVHEDAPDEHARCAPRAAVVDDRAQGRAVAAPADADGDGVVDRDDRCPTEAASAADGCPRKVIVVENGGMTVLQPVMFARNSAKLVGPNEPILRAVATLLTEHPEVASVTVEGHADFGERDPLALGRAPAVAVADFLVAQGVDRARLTASSAGIDRPIAPNGPGAKPEDLARNRRVAFVIEPVP